MINEELVNQFKNIIGSLSIAVELNAFSDVKEDYVNIKNDLLNWVTYYFDNKKLDIVTHERSLEIHDLLDDIKWKKITNKEYGIEKMISDDILNRYEAIMVLINRERGVK